MRKLTSLQRKITSSAIWLAAAMLACSSLRGLLLEKTPIVRLDERTETYVEKTMGRAASTFAIVRGLNGMISVIQGIEVAVSPAGIGLNLSVGEVLDPINDLTDWFDIRKKNRPFGYKNGAVHGGCRLSDGGVHFPDHLHPDAYPLAADQVDNNSSSHPPTKGGSGGLNGP